MTKLKTQQRFTGHTVGG